jgi:RHS repeat-associated protein
VAQSGPGVNATFQYDALGRRISKTINGVATIYLSDGNDIVQEIGGSAVGASYVRSLSIDEPFVRQMASGNEFYHTDALGSTLALSSGAGAATVSYSYEAFGKITVSGTSTNTFQFTGRENDSTGLVYYRARYYSPALQRFLGEDPIGFNGGINLFAYVLNTPINRIDPFGLASICCRGVTGFSFFGNHCFIVPNNGRSWSLRDGGYFGSGPGVIDRGYDDRKSAECEECKPKGCKDPDQCFARVAGQYPDGGTYNFGGPNSNTFAARLANACCDGGFPNKFKRRAIGSEADPPYPQPPNDMR